MAASTAPFSSSTRRWRPSQPVPAVVAPDSSSEARKSCIMNGLSVFCSQLGLVSAGFSSPLNRFEPELRVSPIGTPAAQASHTAAGIDRIEGSTRTRKEGPFILSRSRPKTLEDHLVRPTRGPRLLGIRAHGPGHQRHAKYIA